MTDVSALGAGSLGIWSRQQALAAMSVGRYDAAVRGGCWQTVWPGVHADAGYDLDAHQRAYAAVLASGGGGADARPTAYACGRTAARCWELPLVDDDDPATGGHDLLHDDVGVDRHQRVLGCGDRFLHRRQLRLRPGEVVCLASGLWLTSPSRTLADCAALLTPDALVCCLDAALRQGLTSDSQLARQVAAVKGSRHAPDLRRAAAAADRGRSPRPRRCCACCWLRTCRGSCRRSSSSMHASSSWRGSTWLTSRSGSPRRPTGEPAMPGRTWWPRTAGATSGRGRSAGRPSASRGSTSADGRRARCIARASSRRPSVRAGPPRDPRFDQQGRHAEPLASRSAWRPC